MSNSISTLDQISSSQAQKEVTANAIDDAESPASFGGRQASMTANLTWGSYGGDYYKNSVMTQLANLTLAMTANVSNFVEFDPVTGNVSSNTTAFSDGRVNLYTVVADAATISSYKDWRNFALELNKGAPSHIFHCTPSSDFVGANANTAQQVFNTSTNGAITLASGVAYAMEAQIVMTRAAGNTAHTLSTLFGGTCTFTSLMYAVEATSTTGNALGSSSVIYATDANAIVITASSNVTTENNVIRMKGVMRANVGGTVIPQVKYSAAPGGAPTFLKNSFIRFIPLGSNTVQIGRAHV